MTESLEAYVHDEKAKHFLRIIKNCTSHLALVVEDSLEMTRIENNEFQVNLEMFNIHNMIEEALDIMSFQTQMKRIDLKSDIEENVPVEILSD